MFKRFILLLFLPLIGIQSVKADDIYVKVTSPGDLVAGAQYILAATKPGTTYVATGFNNGKLTASSSGFTISEDYIKVSSGTPLQFKLDGSSSSFTLKFGEYYLGYYGDADLEQDTNANENKEKWALTYNGANSTYLITNIYAPTRYLGKYLDPNLYIKAYLVTSADKYPVVYLYRKVSTVTLAAACTDGVNCYGTYSYESAFVVPSDLTVSEIKVVDGKLTVGNYKTDDVVPANTGVMVSSTTSGDHYVTLTTKAGSSLFGSENMLMPSGNGITAEGMAEAAPGCKYYRLTMHNGTTLGYYWGAADGAAFALGANKAYLAVPIASARLTGFEMADSETTNLREKGKVKSEKFAAAAVYDLQGRRVADASLKKGLYIVNGKKYIIK